MAYFTPAEFPDHKYYLFGKNGCKRLAEEMQLPFLGEIPLVQSIAEGGDSGKPVALDERSPEGEAFLHLASEVIRRISVLQYKQQ